MNAAPHKQECGNLEFVPAGGRPFTGSGKLRCTNQCFELSWALAPTTERIRKRLWRCFTLASTRQSRHSVRARATDLSLGARRPRLFARARHGPGRMSCVITNLACHPCFPMAHTRMGYHLLSLVPEKRQGCGR